jgi:hypothetical protein
MTQLVEPVDSVPPASCSGPHSAEIFYQGTMAGDVYPVYPRTLTLTGTAEFNRAQRVCHDQARRYVGEFDDGARWRVPPHLFVRVTVPSAAAWNTGQRWFSCQAVPRSDLDPVAFDGTVAGAQAAVRPPPIMGSCADRLDGQAIDCPLPHSVEQLTVASVPIMMQAQRAVHAAPPACTELASTIIGRADPTFGGRISIIDHVEPLQRSCWVVSADGTRLTGSLIGHGERPLGTG